MTNASHTIPDSQFLSFCSHIQSAKFPTHLFLEFSFFLYCISQAVSSRFQLLQKQNILVDFGFQLPAKAIKKYKTPEVNSLGTAHSGCESKRRESASQEYTANPPCNENRLFPPKFSLHGKTISNENRFFPGKKTSQGKSCFHYRFFPVKVCSVV